MNFFKSIFKKILIYQRERRAKRRQRIIDANCESIKRRFDVQEHHGKIYILCEGTAVHEATENESAMEITTKIEKMRQTAVTYYLRKSKQKPIKQNMLCQD